MTTTDDDDDVLRDLGKQLPVDRPSADRRDALRSQLIASAAQPVAASPRRWLFVGAGFAAGIAATIAAPVLLGLRSTTRPIVGNAPARIDRTRIEVYTGAAKNTADEELFPNGAGASEEILHLHSGTSRLVVPAYDPHHYAHVQTSDSDIEGSGEWKVVVDNERLESIDVTNGIATLRIVGQGQRVYLATGQSWRAPVQTADLGIAPPPLALDSGQKGSDPISAAGPQEAAPRPPVRVASSAKPRATPSGAPIETELEPPTPTKIATEVVVAPAPAVVAPPGSAIEQHFRAGWALLRANKLAEASVELGAAADAGDSPLAADARYYQAVALVKARRGAEAERALVQFLDRAPASIRRGRAAMMLGRLLADRGDREHARAWFEQAARDPDPAVAAAANAELAAAPR